jgi:hypothetical protein
MVTLPSGLQYRDIIVGNGPNPQPGYQARAEPALHAHAMATPTAHPHARTHSLSFRLMRASALRTQAVVDYVAMTGEGRIFENSLENGKVRARGRSAGARLTPQPCCAHSLVALVHPPRQPYDIRVVTGDSDNPANTIAGLNEARPAQRASSCTTSASPNCVLTRLLPHAPLALLLARRCRG